MKIDIEKLKDIIKEHPDWTYARIAKEFRCTTRAISKAVIVNDIPYTHRHIHRRAVIKNEELKEYVLAHPEMTYDEIGEKFFMTRSAVGTRMRQFGISRRNKDIEEREKIVKEFAANHPDMRRIDMAAELGYPYHFVTNTLSKAFGRKQQNWIDIENMQEEISKNPKITRTELAQKYGVSVHAISAAKARIKHKKEQQERKQPVRRKWEEIEKCLKENPNMTLKDIAKKLGVCMGTVGLQISKHNMKRGHKRKIDYEHIAEEIANGKSVNELAKQYGVKQSAISQAAQRLKIALPKKKNAKAPSMDSLSKYIQENPKATIDAIAKHFGVAPQTITAAKARYGLSKKQPSFSKNEIIDRIKNKESQAKIAKELGLSQSTVCRIAHEAGLWKYKK